MTTGYLAGGAFIYMLYEGPSLASEDNPVRSCLRMRVMVKRC